MKTTIGIMALVIGLGLNLNAQNTVQKNTRIKVLINENGKEIKTDTCFNISPGDDVDLMDPKGNTIKVHILKKMEIKDLSSDDKKHLPQDVSNSINDARPFANLNMYPNPTDGNIRITYNSNGTEALKVNVYDEYGKTVLSQVYSGLGNNVDQTVSLSDLSKGIYFVQLIQGTQTEVRKIIVK